MSFILGLSIKSILEGAIIMKKEKPAFNPFLPSYEYIPDAEPYVFDDRVYIFGSHDKFNGKGFCLNDYVSWSAPILDLGNWRFEGRILDRMIDPNITNESIHVAAPDAKKGPDGRYYLYYFYAFDKYISVAVCNEPAGEYKFYGEVRYPNGKRLGESNQDPLMFDPATFIDDDGKVYLYFGFAPKPITRLYLLGKGKMEGGYVVELEQDMITAKTSPKQVLPRRNKAKDTPFENHEFFEASSMRKINGRYYYIYSSDQNHELCYAVGEHPTGPFSYGGTLVSNADIGYEGRKQNDALNYYGNNHGSIVQIKDQWYIFYHRHTNRHEYSRQACAEKITINPDGSIDQVEMTSCGLNNGPLPGRGTYSSHIACNLFGKRRTGSYSPLLILRFYWFHPYFTQSGVDREENPDQYIANMRNGSVAGFKYFSFENTTRIGLEIGGKASGAIHVFTNLDQPPVAILKINVNGQKKKVNSAFEALNGVYPIYIKFIGKGYIDFYSFELN
jgi:arabinoxylan arabinofuranohydrolase